MNLSRPLLLLAISALLTCGVSSAQTENLAQAAKHESIANQAAPLKAIYIPPAPYPGTSVLGKVTLSIVIDEKGNVSDAEALSGPEELVPAALAFVRKWKYEPPSTAPVTRTVEVSYGSRDCPGAISERGEITWSWRLRDTSGKTIAVIGGDEGPPPSYPEEERRAGATGKMVLSLTLNPDGHVKEIHVVKSVSPSLDKAVVDMVRPLKFKRCQGDRLCSGNPNAPLEDLRLELDFRATCNF